MLSAELKWHTKEGVNYKKRAMIGRQIGLQTWYTTISLHLNNNNNIRPNNNNNNNKLL